MAEADWTLLTGSLSTGTIIQGVTAGIEPPNGGGTFVYGMNTVGLPNPPGAAAFFTNQANFAPMSKGLQITGCMQRGPGGGPTGFSPFLFAALVGTSVADACYMLGLSDEDPHRIKLVKGLLQNGIPSTALPTPPATNGMLAVGAITYPVGTWLHLRLDVIANLNGDVVLNVFANDLTANPCTAPVWAPVSGIEQVIDDALGVNTGSAPLVGGYAGFGAAFANVTRRAWFDQITIARQL